MMRARASVRLGLATGLSAVAAGALWAAHGPRPDGGRSLTFVLGNVYLANGGERDSCPVLGDGGVELFFKALPAAERAGFAAADKPDQIASEKRGALQRLMAQRLGFRVVRAGRQNPSSAPRTAVAGDPSKPQGSVAGSTEQELRAAGAAAGIPAGRGKIVFQGRVFEYSSCSNPEDFPSLATGASTYGGPVAAGLNLDGKTGARDFAGANGEKGIDNQLWRVVGCTKAFRENSDPAYARKTFISALRPTLITLEGVDDLGNDPDVTVLVRTSSDALTRDGRGQILARATFTVDPDPRFQARGKGRIVNGELITEPFDVTIAYKEQIIDAPREIRGARIRARLREDGHIDGGIYGYYSIASYWESVAQMTQVGADANAISCPAVRKALEAFADGYRDPKTKRFTAISSALDFYGTKAFAVTPAEVAATGSTP